MAPKGNKNALGNHGGRPTKYKPEYCKAIIDFFSKEPFEIITGEKGATTLPNQLPFYSKFARSIGVTHDCLHKWCKQYPEFLSAYNECKHLQKEFLITNALAGNYPPASFIFTAKNITDMTDKTEVDMNVKVDEIEITVRKPK